MTRRHRALPLLALLLSAALHGAVLAWLLVAAPEVTPGPLVPSRPIQVDVNVVERPAPPAAPPPAPTRRRQRQRPTPTAETPAPASTPPAARPDAAPPSVVADAPTRGPSLRERLFLVPAPAGTPGRDPAGTAKAAPPRAPTAEERVEQGLRMGVAARKARDGFVHAYFTQVLQDALTAAWRAKATLARRGGRGDKTCESQLHLRQGPDGALLDVRVVYPSCDPLQDAELLEDLRIAARSLPAPPAEVLARRPAVESIWRFRFQPPPPWSTSMEFDVVRLVDKRALPPPNPRKVLLVAADVGADVPGPARAGP